MTYAVLKLAHIIGAILIGGGLIGVWLCDMRSRQSRELVRFAEAERKRWGHCLTLHRIISASWSTGGGRVRTYALREQSCNRPSSL